MQVEGISTAPQTRIGDLLVVNQMLDVGRLLVPCTEGKRPFQTKFSVVKFPMYQKHLSFMSQHENMNSHR